MLKRAQSNFPVAFFVCSKSKIINKSGIGERRMDIDTMILIKSAECPEWRTLWFWE
jgi:hypothetical protein